ADPCLRRSCIFYWQLVWKNRPDCRCCWVCGHCCRAICTRWYTLRLTPINRPIIPAWRTRAPRSVLASGTPVWPQEHLTGIHRMDAELAERLNDGHFLTDLEAA